MKAHTLRIVALGSVIYLCLTPALARADKNPKGLADDIRRQEKEVGEARKKLNDAKHQADQAKSAAQKAAAAFERASDKVGDVRRTVQAEHDAAPSLVSARQRVDAARAELEKLSTPLLAKLAQDPAYQQAVAARDQAKAALGALPASAAAREKDEAGKLFSEGQTAVRQLERNTLDADPKVKDVRKTVEDAEAKVKQLIERRDQAIDQDSRLKSAKNDLDQAKSAMNKAKGKLADEMRQLTQAQQHLQSEENRKRELERKQQQNNNKNKNNNNKKKK